MWKRKAKAFRFFFCHGRCWKKSLRTEGEAISILFIQLMMGKRKNISTSLNMRFFSKRSIIIFLADHGDYADLFHNHLPRL
ncbi:hypothetical protein C1634_012250 [Chryseobacterium viscerum]|uniref:Uncharacterized protein n=1 Tax=Chryseobacterium viscerum TaxID=1037377 RepID=A0A316WQM2_9FLAO|nr:hypothetical protein C1634_012250 [Chryseobacterium viscerum]